MHFVRTPSAPLRRLALLATAFVLAILSCGREPTGPGARGGPAVRYARGLSFHPVFPPAYQAAGGSSSGIVEFNRVRIVLRRADGTIALDTVVNFPPDSTSILVSLTVPLSASAPATGEPLSMNLGYVNAAGDTVFRGGPVTVNAVPAVPGQPAPPPVEVPVSYTGLGSTAARVVASPRVLNVFEGNGFDFTAVALDASGTALPGTPIVWHSLDPAIATITSPAAGAGTAQGTRGAARIIAQLLTGPKDTVTVNVQLLARNLAAQSGSGQTGVVGTQLAQPIVAQVTASDGVGVSGVAVSFAVASGGGSVANATVTTDAGGLAQTTWRLGATVGAQTVTASAAGLSGSPVTFSATARSGTPARLAFVAQPAASTPAGTVIGLVSVQALDAFGSVATSFTGTVSLSLGAGSPAATLLGTVSATAVAGVATFADLRINTAGAGYTLVASAAGLTSATSNAFAITVGAARRLEFGAYPISATAGVVIDPITVIARDTGGNVATGFTDSVRLALAAGPAGAPLLGRSAARAVAGVALFDSVRLNVAGQYRFSASASGVTGATGPLFDLLAGPAAVLALVSGGAQTAAGGTPLAQPVVVQVMDAFGNPVAGAGRTVTFTASAGGSAAPPAPTTNAAGQVSTTWTLGATVGAQTLTASSAGLASLAIAATATTPTGPPSAIASTTVTPPFDTLTSLGDTRALAAQARDTAGAPLAGSFTWMSRNSAVATVSAAGLVTAITNGTTYVVVTEAGGTKDSSRIVVQQRLATINVTPGVRNIYLTRTFTFTAAAVDGRGNALAGTTSFTWTSTAPAIATVDTGGLVTGVGLGASQIRATSGAVTGVANVGILTPITRIVVARDSGGASTNDVATLPSLGITRSYRAIAHDTLDAVMTGITFNWASTNGAVALLDSLGTVTARALTAANGVTAIQATAQGITGSATLTVAQVLAAIGLSPATATIAIGGTQPLLARGLDANARYIGTTLSFTYSSANASIAPVSAAGVVTGVALGTVNIFATSGSITSNAAAVTVSNTGVPSVITFGRDTLSVGRGGSTSVPIFLSKSYASPLTINLAVRDTFAFWSTASVTIPANQNSINATLNGRNAGTTEVYATDGSGAGYAGDTAVLAVQATLRLTTTGYSVNATDQVATQVVMSDPSPAGGTYVTFNFSVAGKASVSPNPAFIPAGQLAADIQILGVAAGSTNITPSAIGVNGTASSFTVYAPILTFNTTSIRLGNGQYETGVYVYAPWYTVNAFPVTLTSSDTNKITVTPSVIIPAGSYYAYFTITTRSVGAATITAAAPGWTSANTVTVTSTTPAVLVFGGTTLNTTSPAQNFSVYSADSLRNGHYRTSSLVVRLGSSDTTVLRVLDTIVTIAPGQYYNGSGRVIPGGAGGSAKLRATASGHFSDSTTYTVIGPKLEFSWGTNRVGLGQQDNNVYVYAPNNVTVPLVVTLTADTTTAGIPPSVTIPAGTYYAYFNVRGKALGSVPIIASATGYQGDTATYIVTTPRLTHSGGGTINNFAPPQGFYIYATDSVGNGHIRTTSLAISLSSTNPSVITVDTSATIPAGQYYTTTPPQVTFVGVGTAQIIATAAGHRSDTLSYTVIVPKLNISFFSTMIGKGQHFNATDFYVYTPNNVTAPLSVTLTQKQPSIIGLTATSLTIPASTYYAYFGASALTQGADTVIATATGYLPDTAFYTVTSPKFTNSGLPGSTTTTNPPITVYVYATDSVGIGHYVNADVVVRAVSSDSNVIRPAQSYFRITQNTYYNTMTVNVIGPGSATLTYSDSAGSGYASTTTNSITVTGPSLAISNGTTVLGMRQNSGSTGWYVYTPNNVGTPLTVNLVSTGTRVATVPASVVIPAGSYYAYFQVTAQDTIGTVQIQATATGYNAASSNVQVTVPKFVISSSSTLNTTSPSQIITIYATDANGTGHLVNENVTVTLASSAPTVASIDSTTVTIVAGQYYTQAARWGPGIVGTSQLSATDARAVFYKYTTGTFNVAVVTPSLSFSWNTRSLGIGQYDDYAYASTPDNQAAPLTVTLSHTGTARTSTFTNLTSTPISSLTIPAASSYLYFRLAGASAGTDTLVASATTPAHNPDTAYTTVGQGRIDPISGWPTSLAVGDSVAVTFYARDPSQGVHYVLAATTWTLAPNANIQFRSGGAVITSVTIPASAQSVTFYVKALTSGTGSATITATNYQSYTNTFTIP